MPNDFPLDLDDILRVVNHLNAGVYVTDTDRRILMWSRKAEEITGHKAVDVVGKHCRDNVLNHVDKYGNLLCQTDLCPLHRAIVTNSESKQPILVYGLKAGGGRAALATSVAPLKDEAGNVVGGVETFQDETENLRDLEFAQRIQRNLMPAKLPRTGGIAFDARYYPHDLVGGDFYDVDDLGDGRYALFVADVRGHGVSASLYTMLLKSMKDSFSALASDPSALLAAMNRELTKLVVSESFATAAYSVIDTNSWQAIYASAGQPPALHYQALSKTCLPLDAPGMPLGLDASETYDTLAVNLLPGDALFYYTDGLTDIRLKNGKLFGEEGLSRVFSEETAAGPDRLLDRIYETASSLNSEVAINDDILMLVARRVA